MGKSTAQSILEGQGIPVVDTDRLARALVEPGQPALAEIKAAFGGQMFNASGVLRRDALAELVFADADARHRLESILHPRIRSCWGAEVDGWRHARIAVGAVVIPLLYETGSESSFATTVCVACSAATQLQRLMGRGWKEAEIQRRIAAQWPVEQKIAASHHLVWTEGPLEVHSAQWDVILRSR